MQDGEGSAPAYGRRTGEDHWVAYDPSAEGGVKGLIQIGTWSSGSTAETCTKIYERHYLHQNRATWEATGEAVIQGSFNWRTYGYCCSGMCDNKCRLFLHFPLKLHITCSLEMEQILNKFMDSQKYF